MDATQALAVLNAYEVPNPANYQNQFGARKAETGTYAIDKLANFKDIVAKKIEKLRELLTYLDKDVPDRSQRGNVLIAVNSIFGFTLTTMVDNQALLSNATLSARLLQLHGLAADQKEEIRKFYAARKVLVPQRAPIDVAKEVVEIFVGRDNVEVVGVLTDVNANSGDVSAVRTTSIAELIRLRQACPGSRFSTGFMRWGPGDSGGDSDLNLKNHFLKHVCDSTQQFPDEAPWWWGALEINVKKTDLLNPTATEDTCFKDDGNLDRRKVKDFIQSAVRNRPELRDALFMAYKDRYSAYAFKLSKELESAIVECNGTIAGISGFAGHLFLFGRFDSPVSNDLGLSSCYFVVKDNRKTKLKEDKPGKMWALTK